MSSLLAILLVAKSSLGAHLVYGYPSTPHPVPRTTKPIYHATRRQQARYQGYEDVNEESSSSEDSSDGEEEDGPDRENVSQLLLLATRWKTPADANERYA